MTKKIIDTVAYSGALAMGVMSLIFLFTDVAPDFNTNIFLAIGLTLLAFAGLNKL